MTVAAGGQPEVQAYLEVVRDALADLPTAERDDLLAEVEASLAEAADEGEGPIAARLGPPQDFATELRTAAGLHAGVETQRPGDTRVRDLADKLERWARRPGVVTARKLAYDLAPIWWAAPRLSRGRHARRDTPTRTWSDDLSGGPALLRRRRGRAC